jgi:DNA polymerase-3 subunit epsilon
MDFAVIDFETANNNRSSACSIGIAIVSENQIQERYCKLLRPTPFEVGRYQEKIHKLTKSDLENAPTFADVWHDIRRLLSDKILVAHQASFDMSVLRHVARSYSIDLPEYNYVCSLELARLSMPDELSHKLNWICKKLSIPLNHHDAMSDAEATAEMILYLMNQNKVSHLSALLHEFGVTPGRIITSDFYDTPSYPKVLEVKDRFEIDIPDGFDPSLTLVNGKTVLLTGSFANFNKAELSEIINTKLGGTTVVNWSKKVNLLVIGEVRYQEILAGHNSKTEKLRNAEKLKESGGEIEICSENEFIDLIQNPSKPRG